MTEHHYPDGSYDIDWADDEREALVTTAFRKVHHDDPERRYSVAEVKEIVYPLIEAIRRQGPITDAQVEAAVKAYRAPRLHVNDTRIDQEIDMRAALEAAREAS